MGTDTAAILLLVIIVAALCASISIIVLVLAFRRKPNEADELAERIAELARRDVASQPRLAVEIARYHPPDADYEHGDLTFTIRNPGHVEYRLIDLRTESGDGKIHDVPCSIEVHPGCSVEVSADILPPDGNSVVLKVWLEIETPDKVRRRYTAEWGLRRGLFVLQKSGLADE